jgi:hypothetical protein
VNNLNSKNFKNTSMIFLTAGEVPASNNLISSQVFKLAESFQKNDIFDDVRYYGFIPLRYLFVSLLKRRFVNFSFIDKYTFNFKLFRTNFILGGFFEFLLKGFIVKYDSQKLSKILENIESKNIIIHCRSYYATYLAIETKKICKHDSIKIVFDMRSLFPPEFPFMMGKKGKMLYGYAKEWESYLLQNSDVSLMTTQRWINILISENPNPNVNLHYIPIMGLNGILEDSLLESFNARWQNKILPYIGSISPWHPKVMIEKVLVSLKKSIKNSRVEIITYNQSQYSDNISIRGISHHDIEKYYSEILGLVVPGKTNENYFDSLIGSNLFSTKASEAISMGVPLIVNEELGELTDFVMKNKCGIVFKIVDDKIIFPYSTIDDLNSRDFWFKMTINAFKVSKEFTFKEVSKQYLHYYQGILNHES